MANVERLPAEKARAFSSHAAYEVWMFREVLAMTQRPKPTSEPEEFIVTEAFALHFRNLVSFVWAPRNHDTDLLALDFVRNPDAWMQDRPSKSAELQRYEERADTEIAHLTTKRLSRTPERKYWPYLQVAILLRPAFFAFEKAMDPGRVDPETRSLIREIQQLLVVTDSTTRVVGDYTVGATYYPHTPRVLPPPTDPKT